MSGFGAKDEIRTRDPDLGKVVLYQLSYFRLIQGGQKYINFYNALFVESNPVPVKYALSLMNISNSSVRLPLFDLSEESREKIRKTLELKN